MRRVAAVAFRDLTRAKLLALAADELARLRDPDVEPENVRNGRPWPAIAEALRRLGRVS
jgi:hypothetical protein